MRRRLALFLTISSAAPASAQVALYDAGTAGNPPVPPDQLGYLLASLSAGFVQHPGGSQGNLCLAGHIARFVGQVQSSGAGGAFTIPLDLHVFPANPATPVAPCTPGTSSAGTGT